MSQTWNSDTYASGSVAATNLQSIEDNFDCLRTTFLGASPPASPVAGLNWHDSANALLKHYYSGGWETIYDLANSRALAALTAVNCSRSIIAGTGLDGGGALTANRTINHTSHSGDVTGSGALTIGDNAINPTKSYPGALLVAGGDGSEYTVGDNSYSSASQVVHFAFKCPSGPTVLRLWARLRNNHASTLAYARLTVTGIGSATEGANTPTYNVYDWYDCNTLNMSGATPGTVYKGYIDIRTSNGTYVAFLQGFSIWWE